MTRRSDMMCEDIWGCDHKVTIPIVDEFTGAVIYWRCTCGARQESIAGCKNCGGPAAYPGAVYCGAACTALAESGK